MITKTAKRKTVTTTVLSPMPISAIRIGTSAEIGALIKIFTHRPRIFPTLATRAMSTPMGMPTKSARAMPRPKERREITVAALNFPVGTMVIAAAITPENGGTMVDHWARPMTSQRTNQIASENRMGMFFPNKIMGQRPGVLECWSTGVMRKNPLLHCSSTPLLQLSYVVFQDLPYLVHGIEVILVTADFVRDFALTIDVGLDDFRDRSRAR